MNRYLMERKKRGTADFYMTRIVEAPTMTLAIRSIEEEFSPGDQVRATLLSVDMVAVRDPNTDGGWRVPS